MKHLTFGLLFFISQTISAQEKQADLNFFRLPFIEKFDNKITKINEKEASDQPVIILKKHIEFEYYIDPVSKDLKKTYGYYLRYKILTNEGIQENKKVSIPISSEKNILVASLAVIQPDNSFKRFGINDFQKLETDGSEVFIHAYEGLTVGSEIELYYLFDVNVSLYGGFELSSNYEVRNTSVSLLAPESLIFNAKAYNISEVFAEKIKDNIRYLEISVNDIKKVKNESYALQNANEPRVEYSFYYNKDRQRETMQTWNSYASKIMETLLNEKESSQKAFMKLIKSENLQGVDAKSTIRNIENYIKTKINIDKEAPSAPLEDVFKNKYANEMVVQKLFATLFELTNVKYEIVTGISKSEKTFDQSFVSWSYLKTIFFYFPDLDEYMSPSNPFIRLGYPENDFSDSKALFIESVDLGGLKSYVGQVKEIEDIDCKINADNMDINLSIDKSLENVNFTYLRSFNGQMVNNLKGYYDISTVEKKGEFRENILRSFIVENIDIKKSSVENFEINADNWYKPMIFKAEVSSKALLELAGPKLFLKVGELIGSQSELYDENERRNDINIVNQHGYFRKITVNIPDGFEVANLEDIKMDIKCFKGKEKLCEFVSSYVLIGNVLEIKIDENYCKTQLPKSVYPDFQKVINAAADWNKVALVIQKKK